jgi:hypothetical protein
MAFAQLDLVSVPISRTATARTAPPTSAAYAASPVVFWWLIQGMVLGAVGGGVVSGLVIALVLGLRYLLTGA